MTNEFGTASPTVALTLYLRSIGKDLGYTETGTYSTSIKNVLVEYCRRIGFPEKHLSETIFLSFTKVKNYILQNKPVILFGSFYNDMAFEPKRGNHAVLAYGTYQLSSGGSNGYIVHYGWEQYAYPDAFSASAILLSVSNSPLGSIFTLWQ